MSRQRRKDPLFRGWNGGIRREALGRPPRSAVGHRRIDRYRQARDRPGFEDRGDGQADAKLALDRPHQAHRQKRVAAEGEEVVVATAGMTTEEGVPQRGDARLGSGARWFTSVIRFVLGKKGEKGLAIDLAVGVDRQGDDRHQAGRHERRREAALEPGSKSVDRLETAIPAGDESHQRRLTIMAEGEHGNGLHGGVLEERVLDFPRLNAVAADLDLLIHPLDEQDRAVGEAPAEVAAAVHRPSPAVGVGIGHEAAFAESEIALGNPRSTDPEFSGLAIGDDLTVGRQDEAGGVREWPADRHRSMGKGIGRIDDLRASEGGGLGRSVAIRKTDAGERLERSAHMRDRQHIPTRQHVPDRREGLRGKINDTVEKPSGEPETGNSPRLHDLTESMEVEVPVGVDHHRAAVEQRPPQFERRGIEGRRRRHQGAHLRAKVGVGLPGDKPDHRAVGHHHPLRSARRARREHHIRRILRVVGWLLAADHGVEFRIDEMPTEGHTRDPRPRPEQGSAGLVIARGHDRGQPCGVHDRCEAVDRIIARQRGIGGAATEHGENRDDELDRSPDPDANNRPGPDASLPQIGSERATRGGDLGIGPPLLPALDRHRNRAGGRLLIEHPMHAGPPHNAGPCGR